MEETIPNLRSRSRSKTPLPQQSRDREDIAGEHVQGKTGRKTPVISRDTPTRLITTQVESIPEDVEKEVVFTSPPAHRTRNALRQRITPIPRIDSMTPTFSLDDDDPSPGKSGYLSEEHAQNVKNYSYEYERITTSSSLWNNVRRSSSRQQPSPSGSERSNESFAESVLADSSRLSGSGIEHLPYKVYKNAGEYWNKYPKTDYTYSRLSKDRVELAPGQVAVPNMSRPSLHVGRHGYSADQLYSHGSSSTLLGDASDLRQRWTTDTQNSNSYGNHLRYESISDTELDEVEGRGKKSKRAVSHWWITTLIITVVTTIVTTVTTITNKVVGRDPTLRYPYYVTPENYLSFNNKRTEETTWYTKVGETVKRRRWWLLLLLLLLIPFAFLYTNPEYGEKITDYASKSVSNLKFPNVSLPQFHMPDMKLPEFSLPNIPFPEFSLPDVKFPKFSFPNITLPEFALPESFPKMSNMRIPGVEMPEAFYEYKTAASSKMSDFAEYISVLGQNWLNELQKMWSGIIDCLYLYCGTIASLYPYIMYSSDSKVLTIADEPANLDLATEHFDKHSHSDKFINMERQQGYYERPVKFEITDDLINTIVMRVKQILPTPERPVPQIIERIIEKSNNDFDPTVLTRQEELINKLTAEINALKALNKNDDEETMSALISKHTTRTIIQLLGLPSNDGASVSKEDVKLGLLQESKHYVDEQLLGFQQLVSDDLGKIKEGVQKDLKGIHKEIVLSHSTGETKQAMHVEVGCQQCDDAIMKIVKEALIVYDADKTGLVDYALESAGGQVVSTRCTESYQPNSAVYSLFGIPLWYPSNSPRTVITPGSSPGECWAFKGFPGYLVIKLYKRINVTGFTLEHTPSLLTPHGHIESAPKKFTVWGLQDLSDHEPVQFGSFEYLNDSTPLQYFRADIAEAKPGAIPGHDLVEIRIESNHGNPVYSCLYRFRVHGEPVDEYSFYGNGPDR